MALRARQTLALLLATCVLAVLIGCTQADAAGYRISPAGAGGWSATLAADAQQDTMAAVDTTAPTVTGCTGATYQWYLWDPTGADRAALYTGTDTDADPGGWTADWTGGVGVWIEQVAVTCSGVTNTISRRVQVGTDAGIILLDLSAGSTVDTSGIKAGSTSLGTSSTMVLAAQHGWPGTSVDAWFELVDVGAAPADATHLRVAVDGDPPGTNPDSSSVGCGWAISPDDTPVSNEGFYQLLAVDSANNIDFKHIELLGTDDGTLSPSPTGTTMSYDVLINIDNGSPAAVVSRARGDTTGDNSHSHGGTGLAGTWSSWRVGSACGRYAGSPSGEVTFANFIVGYAWVARAQP